MAELNPVVIDLLRAARDANAPDYWQLSPKEARQAHEDRAGRLSLAPTELHQVATLAVPSEETEVPVRLYVPRKTEEPLPALVWLHGGGHCVGSPNSYDAVCRYLSHKTDCTVISVDYRLAPEHPFPAAVEDCMQSIAWVHANARALGVDPDRIAVGGDSAGANLATVCAMLARDEGNPPLCFQLLIYPIVAPWPDTESHDLFGEGHLLTRKSIDWFQTNYAGDAANRQDWRFAPILSPDLSRLPPALVIVAGFDPLRDEGIAYAERLSEAGVEVSLSNYEDMVHAFINMGGVIQAARDALDESALAMRSAFGTAEG